MNPSPYDNSDPRSLGRLWFGVCLLVIGLLILVRPFVVSGDTWSWRLQSEAELNGATINAEPKDLGSKGLTISPVGDHPMSVISPPLKLPASACRILRIDVERAAPPADKRDLSPVQLLWQTEQSAAYKFQEATVDLSGSPGQIYFSLPVDPASIHRIGVRFPELAQPITISAFELAQLPTLDRFGIFARQFAEPEPLRNHSINFVSGPLMLGQGLNYYLLGMAALGVGVYGLIQYKRRVLPHWRIIVGIVAAIWLIADIKATANVAQSVMDERTLYKGKPRLQQIADSEGSDIAWAYQQLLTQTPAQSRFAVVSDDTFAPAHRLGYLLAPLNIRVDKYNDADFIVVIRAADAQYKRQEHLFSWGKGPGVPATMMTAKSDGVYLLRRTKP